MAKEQKKKKGKKEVPANALPNQARQKMPIVNSEGHHSFVISTAYLEDDGPACRWSECDGAQLFQVMHFLGQKQRDKNGAQGDDRDHYQTNEKKIPLAVDWLENRPALKDFKSYLWSFRISGKHRVWGIMIDDVFYVLWNDPDHQIYDQTN